MMSSDELKRIYLEIAERHGRTKIIQMLVLAGVSVSVADKITAGRYESIIGEKLNKRLSHVLEELKVKTA